MKTQTVSLERLWSPCSLKLLQPQLNMVMGSQPWVTLLKDRSSPGGPSHLSSLEFQSNNLSNTSGQKIQLKAAKIHQLALALTQPRNAHAISSHQFIFCCKALPLPLRFGMGSSSHFHHPAMQSKSSITYIRERGTSGWSWAHATSQRKAQESSVLPSWVEDQVAGLPSLMACPGKAGFNCCFLTKPRCVGVGGLSVLQMV